MKIISLYSVCLIFTVFLAANAQLLPERESLEIVIGGGNGGILGGTIGGGGGKEAVPPPEYQLSPPEYQLSPPAPPEYQVAPPPEDQVSCPPSPPPPQVLNFVSERIKIAYYVIQRLKTKITCDPFRYTDTWVGPDVCNYKGFLCDIIPTYNVTALAGVSFNGYAFAGDDLRLKGFVDELPDLAFFHINSNNFTGGVPERISKIPFLFELDVSNNKLTGEFPYSVLNAVNLTFLDLRFNFFAGKLPPSVFHLDLDVLFLNNNNFFQNLPYDLGNTPALFLTLANNRFTGPIPPTIGKLAKTLREVLFLNNLLSGCLPYEIGLLGKTTVFDVGTNYLTGPIPHSFACLKKIELLNLARNQFYGAIPESVCKLPNLLNVTVSFNYFTQVGPACRSLIKKGILDVKQNCIEGVPNQRSPSDCAAFFHKPAFCPEAWKYKLIPCGEYYEEGADSLVAPPPGRKLLGEARSSWRTYGALVHDL